MCVGYVNILHTNSVDDVRSTIYLYLSLLRRLFDKNNSVNYSHSHIVVGVVLLWTSSSTFQSSYFGGVSPLRLTRTSSAPPDLSMEGPTEVPTEDWICSCQVYTIVVVLSGLQTLALRPPFRPTRTTQIQLETSTTLWYPLKFVSPLSQTKGSHFTPNLLDCGHGPPVPRQLSQVLFNKSQRSFCLHKPNFFHFHTHHPNVTSLRHV